MAAAARKRASRRCGEIPGSTVPNAGLRRRVPQSTPGAFRADRTRRKNSALDSIASCNNGSSALVSAKRSEIAWINSSCSADRLSAMVAYSSIQAAFKSSGTGSESKSSG